MSIPRCSEVFHVNQLDIDIDAKQRKAMRLLLIVHLWHSKLLKTYNKNFIHVNHNFLTMGFGNTAVMGIVHTLFDVEGEFSMNIEYFNHFPKISMIQEKLTCNYFVRCRQLIWEIFMQQGEYQLTLFQNCEIWKQLYPHNKYFICVKIFWSKFLNIVRNQKLLMILKYFTGFLL